MQSPASCAQLSWQQASHHLLTSSYERLCLFFHQKRPLWARIMVSCVGRNEVWALVTR